MTAEMPARIEAVPHARVVEFPWASATSVGATIGEAAAALSASLESRAAMAVAISDWQGAYRLDFDASQSIGSTPLSLALLMIEQGVQSYCAVPLVTV